MLKKERRYSFCSQLWLGGSEPGDCKLRLRLEGRPQSLLAGRLGCTSISHCRWFASLWQSLSVFQSPAIASEWRVRTQVGQRQWDFNNSSPVTGVPCGQSNPPAAVARAQMAGNLARESEFKCHWVQQPWVLTGTVSGWQSQLRVTGPATGRLGWQTLSLLVTLPSSLRLSLSARSGTSAVRQSLAYASHWHLPDSNALAVWHFADRWYLPVSGLCRVDLWLPLKHLESWPGFPTITYFYNIMIS